MALSSSRQGPVQWTVFSAAMIGCSIYLYFLPKREAAPFMAQHINSLHHEFDWLGEGLRFLADYLEHDHNRRPKFRDIVSQVAEHKGIEQKRMEINLILLADLFEWPQWSVQCLPTLCVPMDTHSDSSRQTLLVWKPIVDVIPENYDFKILERLCSGELLLLDAANQTATLVQRFAFRIDLHRLRNPFPSSRSAHGVVAQALLDIQLEDSDIADAAAAGREAVLDEVGVGFSNLVH